MKGKIFITRTGYDPQLGKHIKDPYLGPCPTLGACRPDVRRQLSEGDHIFVISGKVPQANQFVMGGFEIVAKIDALKAYNQFPQHRLRLRADGQLTGNILVDADGNKHNLDDHKYNDDDPEAFARRIKNYIVGDKLIALTKAIEVSRGREGTLGVLCDILHKRGRTPFEVVGHYGSTLSEKQVLELRAWLASLKAKN